MPVNELKANELSTKPLLSQQAVLILAAGLSERMGCPKFALQYKGKYSFLEQIVKVYARLGFGQMLVAINSNDISHRNLVHIKERYKNIQYVVNQFPEKGRLYSVQLGMQLLTEENCFVQNVDNPFIRENVLNILLNELHPEKILIPSFQGFKGHPIVIPQKYCQNIIKESVVNKTLKMVISGIPQQNVEVDDQSILLNINTPESYIKQFGHPPLIRIGS
jgi:molybdenum cofactor cytidylyltransferase